MDFIELIIILFGLFSIMGAIFNWEWFMNHSRARFIVKIMTRLGARVFYALLGAALITVALLSYMEVIRL